MTTYTCPDGHSSAAADYCDVCGAPVGAGGAAASGPPGLGSAAPSAGPAPSGPPPSSLDLDAPAAPAPAASPTSQDCPNCAASNLPDALFCEDCGYDFTTGQMPRPLPPPTLTPPDVAGAGSSDPGAVLQPPPSDPGVPHLPPAAQAPAGVQWVVEIWVDPDWHAAQDVDDPCPSAGMPVVVPLHQNSVLVGRTSASRNIHPEVDVVGDTGVSRRHVQLTTDGLRWWVEDLQSANGTYLGAAGQPLPADPIAAGSRVELPDDGRIYVGAWTRLVVRKATPTEATL